MVRATNPLLELKKLGQSVWLDDISRGMLEDGSLKSLILEDGVSGLTSNPSIFANSIMHDPRYAAPIAQLLSRVQSSMALYEELALKDLQDAAALLRPGYDAAGGADGYVSMEVSPHLAYDADGSRAEARRLWERLKIPNALIKIPGTEAGVPVIRDLIAAGINVNVTLLFSPDRYREVAQAYIDGLRIRAEQGRPLASVASVASFSSRASTPRSTRPSMHSPPTASRRRARCAARPRSPRPPAPLRCSRRSPPRPSGRAWPRAARVRSGSCGPPPRARIRPSAR